MSPRKASDSRDSDAVQIDRDVVRKLRAVAAHRDVTIRKLVSDQLRAWVEVEYARVVAEMSAELGEQPRKGHKKKD